MLKGVFAGAFCCAFAALAQEPEETAFRQTIADCEQSWFGAEANDGSVFLGYAYIDPYAGFTFEHYGRLEGKGEALRAVPSDLIGKARLIQRVGHNFPATCLLADQVAELGLPLVPETMQFYQDSRPPGEHHAAWAYHYNHIGASDKALVHVQNALEAGAASAALTFEHAFALNVLGKFGETIALLETDYGSEDMTADLIAELAYARLRQGDYERAIELYTQAINPGQGQVSTRRWEFARNIAAAYAELGDTERRETWMKRAKQYREIKE